MDRASRSHDCRLSPDLEGEPVTWNLEQKVDSEIAFHLWALRQKSKAGPEATPEHQ